MGLNFSKTPEGAEFSFGTPDHSSPPPCPRWEPSGRPPYAPALGLLGPWSQLQAGSSSLRGPLPPTTSVPSNPPPLQFPQHSFPDTTQRRQGQ